MHRIIISYIYHFYAVYYVTSSYVSAANWLKPPGDSEGFRMRWTKSFTLKYIVNNLRKVLFLALYITINIILTVYTIYRYRDSNGFVIGKYHCFG